MCLRKNRMDGIRLSQHYQNTICSVNTAWARTETSIRHSWLWRSNLCNALVITTKFHRSDLGSRTDTKLTSMGVSRNVPIISKSSLTNANSFFLSDRCRIDRRRMTIHSLDVLHWSRDVRLHCITVCVYSQSETSMSSEDQILPD